MVKLEGGKLYFFNGAMTIYVVVSVCEEAICYKLPMFQLRTQKILGAMSEDELLAVIDIGEDYLETGDQTEKKEE